MSQDQHSVPRFTDTLDFVAIDTETTGLDAEKCEIIELAAIRFERGREVARFDTFVKPKGSLPKFIQYLTHIDPEDLRGAPPIREALKDFCAFVGDSVLLGHNVGFDLGFINHHLALSGGFPLKNKHWDTAELARVYLPFTNDHKLATMARHFGIKLENAHRADADATATGEVLVAIADHASTHYSMMTNARLLDLSRQALMTDSLAHFLSRLVDHQRRYALLGSKLKQPQKGRENVIEHQIDQTMTLNIKEIFSQDGLFAEKFPRFEFRAGQMDMADRVNRAFLEQKFLCVEAGTGVGKSFSYLVPAISFANSEKARVVVSTNTKNLQEQLFYKDLPQLRELLPLPFKAVLVKGRENYICERRWEEMLLEQSKGLTQWEAQALLYLHIWKMLTLSGDVSENSSFDRNRFSIVWRKVCSDRYLCANRKCPHYKNCYVMGLRKHIESASVVVANHSLLLADLRAENTTLGEYSYLVVDEAHNLMSSASRNLGCEISYADIINLFNNLCTAHKRRKTGFLHLLESNITKSLIPDSGKEHVANISKNLEAAVEAMRKLVLSLFSEAGSQCERSGSFGKLRIKQTADHPLLYQHLNELCRAWKDFQKDLRALSNVLNSFNGKQVPNYDNLVETAASFEMRAFETEGVILAITNPELDDYALWIESNPKPDRNIPSSSLCYAPIEVGNHLKNMLYDKVPCIIFTSATLALRGSFKYFQGQSGLNFVDSDRLSEAIVESPFDFDAQSRLMIASFLPEHKDKFFINQALGCIEQIVTTTDVGTMILFTAYKDLNAVYDHLGDTLYHRDRPFFAQGKAGSRTSILEEFKSHANAVLLGTNSFWEGVDIQGESLSLLILFKIPFQVPSEPLVEAFIDKLEREEKDSFMHYMLPNALLKLRQGFGRLIRSRDDRGIVLIMDSRVSNKRYGEYFKQVLPTACLEMRNELDLISGITRFFNSPMGGRH